VHAFNLKEESDEDDAEGEVQSKKRRKW